MTASSHVLVVGATGGLGAAISRALAAAGASVTLHGRRTDRVADLAAELGERVSSTIAADLINPEAPARVVGSAAGVGPLDGVVFAAGVVAFGELAELDDDALDQPCW